ncbi:cytochrome P450 81C13-like [Mercurialis annua]|uniref:cytochrome P450 81C13-like n=1 Tax=Mercurialis annua TaxID=3986 RepID=UPI00215ED502|nr:cytochrome P450 81C13-like [Mercurialis annua]
MESLYYLFITFSFIFLLYKTLFHRTKNQPPAPFALPIIGHLHKLRNKPLPLALQTLLSQYGPIVSLKFGCRSVLVVSSPSLVEECFTKNDITFANRPRSMAADHFTYNYSSYAWASYGDLWRTLRRFTVTELFSSNSLRRTSAIREQEVCRLLHRLYKVSAYGKQKVDMKFLSSLLMCNVMMRATVGKPCVDVEDEDTEAEKQLLEGFKDRFFPTVAMNICDFIPFLRKIGFKGIEKSMIKTHNIRDEFLQSLIDEIRAKGINKEEKRSAAETLLHLQELEPGVYTDDVIKSIMVLMFIAGVETSAVALEWAMSLLLMYPEILQKLKAEIDNYVGHKRLLNDSDLIKLPYLRCVVNETLRLYPPTPLILPRLSSEACRVGGFEIPKDTVLLVNVWAMHRDPNVWEEPSEFRPERFEEEQHEFKFLPFGMGRRACPGAGMGTRIIALAVGSLIQCFNWEHDGLDMAQHFGLSLSKANPLAAICCPRQEFVNLLSQL